ncbi:UbiD family decarboxylase [bacterium]|nr:UbiD family decarboxylase [bacterium]
MPYSATAEMVRDLQRTGQLLVFDEPIQANLEIAAVLRWVYAQGGPAVLFPKVVDSSFPVVGNLYGTPERARYLLRHGLSRVEKAMRLKADPGAFLRRPWRYADLPFSLPHLLPRQVRRGPVLTSKTSLSRLPRFVSWPQDGGPFVTLPVVYSEHPERPGWMHGNLGMYRVQLAGNEYDPAREVGLHYQLHRGIGIHHQAAAHRSQRLWVNVFVGGPPALTWSAVMPLPETIPELVFAGALAGSPVRLCGCPESPLPLAAEADFALVGWIDPFETRPEGPFGDHLGYYSLSHPFPVLRVEAVYHRPGAIWPVTTVGRPPQEDTTFGKLIHEMTDPVLPTVLPGVKQVHAVDAAGVHPLLLAVASERYTPFQKRRRPQELLTCANAILGQGQLSLAKYLFLAAQEDDPGLNCTDISGFFRHVLERADWRRDLHFYTQTTIDTLDYSGGQLNQGSKLVIAGVGEAIRKLDFEWNSDFRLPEGFSDPRVCLPGVLALQGPGFAFDSVLGSDPALRPLEQMPLDHPLACFPLWVLCDDSRFVAASLANFLWVTFTRSNPAADVYGVEPSTYQKHWGCRGPLIIDARSKPHHAPELVEDPSVLERLHQWRKPGGPLADLHKFPRGSRGESENFL